jgi:hypothetical protein
VRVIDEIPVPTSQGVSVGSTPMSIGFAKSFLHYGLGELGTPGTAITVRFDAVPGVPGSFNTTQVFRNVISNVFQSRLSVSN